MDAAQLRPLRLVRACADLVCMTVDSDDSDLLEVNFVVASLKFWALLRFQLNLMTMHSKSQAQLESLIAQRKRQTSGSCAIGILVRSLALGDQQYPQEV